MNFIVKRLQPDRYDNWLAGRDYERHPEEPNGKLSAAPAPSLKELTLHNKNKVKGSNLQLVAEIHESRNSTV